MIRSTSLTVNTAGPYTGTEHSLDWQIPVRRRGTRYRGDLQHSYSDQDIWLWGWDDTAVPGEERCDGAEKRERIRHQMWTKLVCRAGIFWLLALGFEDLFRLNQRWFGKAYQDCFREFYLPLTVNLDKCKSLHSSSGWRHTSIHILLWGFSVNLVQLHATLDGNLTTLFPPKIHRNFLTSFFLLTRLRSPFCCHFRACVCVCVCATGR